MPAGPFFCTEHLQILYEKKKKMDTLSGEVTLKKANLQLSW